MKLFVLSCQVLFGFLVAFFLDVADLSVGVILLVSFPEYVLLFEYVTHNPVKKYYVTASTLGYQIF